MVATAHSRSAFPAQPSSAKHFVRVAMGSRDEFPIPGKLVSKIYDVGLFTCDINPRFVNMSISTE